MDLYILDDELRRAHLIDEYKSLIWTERYCAYGDFEFHTKDDLKARQLLKTGVKVSINESNRVMIIESIERIEDQDGSRLVVAKGHSMEKLLEGRTTIHPFDVFHGNDIMDKNPRASSGTPSEIIYNEAERILIDNTLMPEDNIYLLKRGPYLPSGSIPFPNQTVTALIEAGDFYNWARKFCDVYDLGLRIIQTLDGSLYFEVYTGNDRTSTQSNLPPVIFSQSLERLNSSREFTSVGETKNVAYVFGQTASKVVYWHTVDEYTPGDDRRVIFVDAQDIDLDMSEGLEQALIQRGHEVLAGYRDVHLFDGEVPQDGFYIYGEDYSLGDLVEMRNDDGVTAQMRVSEQIFIADAEGVRAYPTLETHLLATKGSWAAWEANVEWVDAVGEWEDQ